MRIPREQMTYSTLIECSLPAISSLFSLSFTFVQAAMIPRTSTCIIQKLVPEASIAPMHHIHA